jgi:hypothetical protein
MQYITVEPLSQVVLPQCPGPPSIPQLDSVHYPDANDGEIEINKEFIQKIEDYFRPESGTEPGMAADILIFSLLKGARKIGRMRTIESNCTYRSLNQGSAHSHSFAIFATPTSGQLSTFLLR